MSGSKGGVTGKNVTKKENIPDGHFDHMDMYWINSRYEIPKLNWLEKQAYKKGR